MKIINPIYDKAFKYLMQEQKYAKLLISLILDEEIEELEVSSQETVMTDEKRQLTLFRLDFKAIIRKPDGTRKKVLIELQKSKTYTDILRFRSYLGSNYSRHDIQKVDNIETKVSYPIITIYILGYKLDEIPHLAVKVNHKITDSVSKEELLLKSDFIEHLNHTSHIIQVKRLPEKRQTRLEQFLMFFNQAWISDYNYILDLQDVPTEFKDIASYMHTPLADDDFKRQLDAEEEIDYNFEMMERKYLQAKQAEEDARKAEEEARKAEEEARKSEEQARKSEEDMKTRVFGLAKYLKNLNIPTTEISAQTGLSAEEIEIL